MINQTLKCLLNKFSISIKVEGLLITSLTFTYKNFYLIIYVSNELNPIIIEFFILSSIFSSLNNYSYDLMYFAHSSPSL